MENKRQYKKFTTSIDIEVLKKLKISAIQQGVTVSRFLEMLVEFSTNLDLNIINDLREESRKTGIPEGEILCNKLNKLKSEDVGGEKC